MTAQRPALFPVVMNKGIRKLVTQPMHAGLAMVQKPDLTKGVLTKFMIPVHAFAIYLMHAA